MNSCVQRLLGAWDWPKCMDNADKSCWQENIAQMSYLALVDIYTCIFHNIFYTNVQNAYYCWTFKKYYIYATYIRIYMYRYIKRFDLSHCPFRICDNVKYYVILFWFCSVNNICMYFNIYVHIYTLYSLLVFFLFF